MIKITTAERNSKKKATTNYLLGLLSALLSVIAGFYLVYNTNEISYRVVYFIGIYYIVKGSLILLQSLLKIIRKALEARLNKLKNM